jgi:hypothetical protein
VVVVDSHSSPRRSRFTRDPGDHPAADRQDHQHPFPLGLHGRATRCMRKRFPTWRSSPRSARRRISPGRRRFRQDRLRGEAAQHPARGNPQAREEMRQTASTECSVRLRELRQARPTWRS